MLSAAFCVSVNLDSKLSHRYARPRVCVSKVKNPHLSAATKCSLRPSGDLSNKEPLSPVLILPGLGNSSNDYAILAEKLISRGHHVVVTVPVRRWQWALNAKGFFMLDYWRSRLKPNAVLDWYFDELDSAIHDVMMQCEDAPQINFVGHSAGGWLGRAYLAERAPSHLRVSTLLTLGTPHTAPPAGAIDQTRGLLRYIEENCDISDMVSRFVCVAGRGTKGKPFGKGTVSEFVAFLSYYALCGHGNVDGDGVTPVTAACGTDAELICCDNCDHSMLTSHAWYGSEHIFDQWAKYLS